MIEVPIHPEPVRSADGSAPAMLDYETGLDFANANHLPTLERHLIGCCLADTFCFDEVADIVEPNDFAMPEHSELFRVLQGMRVSGRQITTADVYEHLVKIGRADLQCFNGNAAWWLHETAELEATGSRARYYAIHIREAATFRRLRGAAHEIMGYAYKPFGSASEVLGEAEAKLFELSLSVGPRKETLASAPEMVRNALERIDSRIASGGKLLGIASGYYELDKWLAGFRPGQMVVIGARPSVGKTALALNIAANVAKHGEPVLFFSLEMPEVEIADRLLAMESGVSMHKITSTHFEDGDIARLASVLSPHGISGSDLFVDDNSDQSGDKMLQVARRAVRKFGIRFIVVDYLQLMRPESTKVNRNEQVGALARKVKQIARQLKVPVLCLAQLNREVENRNGQYPKLSDLRDSGEIEQHADGVILLHRQPNQEELAPGWLIDCLVAKNRNGPTGKATLVFLRTTMRFENEAHTAT